MYGQRISVTNATDNGVLIYNTPFRFADIVDGLTHTIAVAEDSKSPDAQWINGRNIFEQSGGVNDPRAPQLTMKSGAIIREAPWSCSAADESNFLPIKPNP